MALHYDSNGCLYISPEHPDEDIEDFVEEAVRIGIENGIEREERLQELLEEFRAERERYLEQPVHGWGVGTLSTVRKEYHYPDTDDYQAWAEHDGWLAATVRETARRYIIARDFNEFDPQRADMLWKLQNGGAV